MPGRCLSHPGEAHTHRSPAMPPVFRPRNHDLHIRENGYPQAPESGNLPLRPESLPRPCRPLPPVKQPFFIRTSRSTNPCSTVYTSAFLILILNPPFPSDFTSIMVTGKVLPHRRQPSHPDASAGWMPALPASPVRRTRVRRYLLCPLPRQPPESFLPA